MYVYARLGLVVCVYIASHRSTWCVWVIIRSHVSEEKHGQEPWCTDLAPLYSWQCRRGLAVAQCRRPSQVSLFAVL